MLEGYFAAEACGAEVAPLVEQLHARLGDARHEHGHALRLVPRRLIHRGDLFGLIEGCGIAQGRQDSIVRLATAAQRLQQRGIGMGLVTRDSAIGNPADIVWETARHFGADLVIVGSRSLGQAWHVAEDPGRVARAPCPVLVVPAADNAGSGAESSAARRGPVTCP